MLQDMAKTWLAVGPTVGDVVRTRRLNFYPRDLGTIAAMKVLAPAPTMVLSTPTSYLPHEIKYYMVDCFHMKNHRCSKSTSTTKNKKRVKTVRTNMSETFNAGIRPSNFFLNSLRPRSGKFWVEGALFFHNQYAQPLSPRHLSCHLIGKDEGVVL